MTTWVLFKLILVLQLLFYQICIVGATKNLMEGNVTDNKSNKESDCYYRIEQIEAKSHEQEQEIVYLKTKVV